MLGFLFVYLVCAFGRGHVFNVVPGGGQSAFAFFPPSSLPPSFACGVLVTSTSVFVMTIDSASGSLNWTSRADVSDFLPPNRDPSIACLMATPSKAFVAVADSGGGVSFSSLSACDGAFVFEGSVQVDDNAKFVAVRQVAADSSQGTGDMMFIALSLTATIGFVEGVSGLQPGLKSVRKFSSPLKSFVGSALSSQSQLISLQSQDDKGIQEVVNGTGGAVGGFVPELQVNQVATFMDGTTDASKAAVIVVTDSYNYVFGMFGNEAMGLRLSDNADSLIPSAAFGPRFVTTNGVLSAFVFLTPSILLVHGPTLVKVALGTNSAPIMQVKGGWTLNLNGTWLAIENFAYVGASQNPNVVCIC